MKMNSMNKIVMGKMIGFLLLQAFCLKLDGLPGFTGVIKRASFDSGVVSFGRRALQRAG